MQPVVVEPADVFHDGELELGSGAPHAILDQLGLERVHEALGQRVVIRVTDRTDRCEDLVVVDDLGVVMGGVLRAGIGVSNQLEVRARVPRAQRHPQRVEHEVGCACATRAASQRPGG